MLMQNLSTRESLWSEMPLEMIHHILSFLPSTREAANTCLISKCWLHAWRSYFEGPCLIFICREEYDKRKIHQFHKFVEHAMSRFDNPRSCCNIQKFVLDVVYVLARSDFLNQWINIAIDNNVQEMTLSKIRFSFGFFERVLNNASLRCLNLNLSGDIQEGINYSINLPKVVTLTLSMHHFYGELLDRFLKGCPLLQTLTIGSRGNTIRIGKQSSVLSIDNSAAKLKHLDLEFFILDTEWFEGFVLQLGSLETLKLKFDKSSSTKGVFSIRNHSMKKMVLDCGMSPSQQQPLVIVYALKLSYFRYVGDMNWYHRRSGVFVYPPRDCIAHFTLMLNCSSFSWLTKLWETICVYTNLRSLSLVYSGKEEHHEIGRWWLDTNLPSTTIEIEHLKLTIDDALHSELFFSEFNKLVSGLFSILHPAIISIEASGNNHGEITRNDLKLLGVYVIMDQDKEGECAICSIVMNKCWKHQLKEVTIKEDEFIPEKGSAVKISFMLKW